ncbi:MAG: efflux RND transporter permease subunit [Ochrobactrum anthropi]|uniref:Efflux RND transporter permease subunit n=1 Tax=Brucella anthropi TaxID=529 RepID=A0A8I0T9D1_BRUAN|nr:efflux RND transporter permease subunit [Brucella anthropi]MBE0561494.1 efflux RND transporter permease subunit [Brucella anthropi]
MSNGIHAIARYRYLVLILGAVLVFASGTLLRNKSIDLLPEFTPPIVEVQTEALGLSAEEVESLITVPMEADLLNGISWIKSITSKSLPGLSSIMMVFEDDTDIWKARQLVQERLTQAHALPNVSRPPVMLQPLSSASRVMQIGLSSSVLTNIEISVEAHWNIKPRLMGVPGVANVSIWGERNRQLQVQVDPRRLSTSNITLSQVLSTTGNALWFSPLSYLDASSPGSGGFIDTPNQRLTIRHLLPISTPEDFAGVVIEGSDLTLGDVTTIVEDHQPLIGDALVGDGPGVLLVVEKFPWADTLAVTRGLEAAIEDLRPSLDGVEIDPTVFRRANFIEVASQNLLLAAVLGGALLLIVLAVLQRDWKSVLVAAVTIPVAMLSAVVVLVLAGIKLDIVLIAGLAAAIGVVINDAVTGAPDRTPGNSAATSWSSHYSATLARARGPVLISSVIAILVTFPLFVIDGVAGAVAMSMALAFGTAVATSLLVSLTVTTALWSVLGSIGHELGSSGRFRFSLPVAVRGLPEGFAGLALILALVFSVTLAFSQRSLIPTFQERSILINWSAMPGTSHPEMMRVAGKVLTELRSVEGVESAGAHIGRAITSDQHTNVNAAQIWVNIAEGADYAATMNAMREIVGNYPGAAREFLNYSEEQARPFTLPDATSALTVRVFGYDLAVLEGLAGQIRESVVAIGGIGPVAIDSRVMEPVVRIEADLEKSKAFGIKPGDIRRTAAILLSGLEVGSLFEDQKVFEVVLWGVPEIRSSVTAVKDLLIDAPDGGLVRLGDVANVSVGSLPSVIHRDAVSRYIDVSVDVRGQDASAIGTAINERLAAMQFPLEYHAELLTDYVDAQTTQGRWVFALSAVAIGVFLLVQAAVGSWRLGLVGFIALAAALSGSTLVMLATGNMLTLASAGALLGVLGVASRGMLALISRYQAMERNGAPLNFDLVAAGSREHFNTILLVGAGGIAALLPAVILPSGPGLEILAPMAVIMIGGLITTTLVILYLVPALYLVFGAGSARLESELFPEGSHYDVP